MIHVGDDDDDDDGDDDDDDDDAGADDDDGDDDDGDGDDDDDDDAGDDDDDDDDDEDEDEDEDDGDGGVLMMVDVFYWRCCDDSDRKGWLWQNMLAATFWEKTFAGLFDKWRHVSWWCLGSLLFHKYLPVPSSDQTWAQHPESLTQGTPWLCEATPAFPAGKAGFFRSASLC